ncbi:MAG: hypothetical protein CM15mP18_2320 [Methanobacteriota archaeon]|nr:MAG: hypothetical protein CM15mP18_2320 [Euryarchaeota archaeon]
MLTRRTGDDYWPPPVLEMGGGVAVTPVVCSPSAGAGAQLGHPWAPGGLGATPEGPAGVSASWRQKSFRHRSQPSKGVFQRARSEGHVPGHVNDGTNGEARGIDGGGEGRIDDEHLLVHGQPKPSVIGMHRAGRGFEGQRLERDGGVGRREGLNHEVGDRGAAGERPTGRQAAVRGPSREGVPPSRSRVWPINLGRSGRERPIRWTRLKSSAGIDDDAIGSRDADFEGDVVKRGSGAKVRFQSALAGWMPSAEVALSLTHPVSSLPLIGQTTPPGSSWAATFGIIKGDARLMSISITRPVACRRTPPFGSCRPSMQIWPS